MTANLPAWRGGLADLGEEHGFRPLTVVGSLPDTLRGVLYRNGPSLFTNHGRRYGHLFDGDGAVSAVRFSGGSADGAVKIVKTRGLLRERRAGRPLYGGWGTPVPGWMRGFQGSAKNPANTSVLLAGGRAFALYEGGGPVEIDPDSLETRGEASFGGAIRMSFSAHPRYSPARHTLYNFGARYNVVSWFDVYAWPAGGSPRRIRMVRQPGPSIVHDCAVTASHLVLLVPPVRINLYTAAFGRRPLQESFSWTPSLGVEVILVPLDGVSPVVRFPIDPFHLWHCAGAWEDGGNIYVDCIAYPDFSTNAWFGGLLSPGENPPSGAALHRLVINPAGKSASREVLFPVSCEFPMIAPGVRTARHRYVYCAAHSSVEASRGWWDRVAKIDTLTGEARYFPLPGGMYPSEPVFVPSPGPPAEDRGWILAHVYDPGGPRTGVLVWEAWRPGEAPVGEAWYSHPLPFTFHGAWEDAPVSP